jgi:hypothetical protein
MSQTGTWNISSAAALEHRKKAFSTEEYIAGRCLTPVSRTLSRPYIKSRRNTVSLSKESDVLQ